MPPDSLAVLLLGALAVILGAEAFKQFRAATKASSWPTAPGRILSSELEDGPPMGRLVRGATHRAAVRYTYEVAGREWTSQRVFFGDEAFEKGDSARDRVRRYEPNSLVQVFVDPEDPANAVLEPRTAWSQAAIRALTWAGITVLALVVVLVAGQGRR